MSHRGWGPISFQRGAASAIFSKNKRHVSYVHTFLLLFYLFNRWLLVLKIIVKIRHVLLTLPSDPLAQKRRRRLTDRHLDSFFFFLYSYFDLLNCRGKVRSRRGTEISETKTSSPTVFKNSCSSFGDFSVSLCRPKRFIYIWCHHPLMLY